MMGNKVVYTCITKAYDPLLQPVDPDPSFRHICFVEKGSPLDGTTDGVWEIRALPLMTGDAGLDSRYPKMHPHELLPDFSCSLWVDANIRILDRTIYDAADSAMARGDIYAGVTHPTRDCVYSEARKCRDMRYIGWLGLFRIWAFYAFRFYPRHAGLLENNLIFRQHNDSRIVALDTLWWKMVANWCRRDQLSLPYCLRKLSIVPGYLLPKGTSSRNCPGLEYRLHASRRKV